MLVLQRGVSIFHVHDVAEMVDVVKVANAIKPVGMAICFFVYNAFRK